MTLQDTVGGWQAYGYSIKQAVHELVALRLARTCAKGKGNRAKRRICALLQAQRKPGAC